MKFDIDEGLYGGCGLAIWQRKVLVKNGMEKEFAVMSMVIEVVGCSVLLS